MNRPLEIGTRRRCDYDGKLYTVKKQDHRFCTPKCRQHFHRFGSAYMVARDKLSKEIFAMVEHAAQSIETRLAARIEHRLAELAAGRPLPERRELNKAAPLT